MSTHQLQLSALVDRLKQQTTALSLVVLGIVAVFFVYYRLDDYFQLGLPLPSQWQLAAAGGLLAGSLLTLYLTHYDLKSRLDDGLVSNIDQAISNNEEVTLEPPDLTSSRFGLLGDLYNIRRFLKKRKKLLGNGYVEWYLINDTIPKPKYIKPTFEGAGIREYKHDGNRYLFPKDQLIPNSQNGMWTAFHQVGDADPLNMTDPKEHSLPADVVEEWSNMRVSSSPPGLLDRLDLTPRQIMQYGIILIIGYAILRGFLQNGIGGF